MIQSVSAILPPLNLPREFAAFIEQLDKSLFAVNKLIEQYDLLYRAKLQEYFGKNNRNRSPKKYPTLSG